MRLFLFWMALTGLLMFLAWLVRQIWTALHTCANCGHLKERHSALGTVDGMWVCWYGGQEGCECQRYV